MLTSGRNLNHRMELQLADLLMASAGGQAVGNLASINTRLPGPQSVDMDPTKRSQYIHSYGTLFSNGAALIQYTVHKPLQSLECIPVTMEWLS